MEEYPINNRRLRLNQHIRELSRQVRLHHEQFIQPLFVCEGISKPTPSPVLNGVSTHTKDSVLAQIERDLKVGVTKFLLFPIPATKSDLPSDFEFITSVIASIKQRFGNTIWLAMDVCLCAYTSHGHCGILTKEGTAINNSKSVQTLAHYALQLAQAGADCIAPSDMMDGRIGAIRTLLNANGLEHIAIMSYSAKFASVFYGPFRDVCGSSPDKTLQLKGRSSYQIDFTNTGDAIRSTIRDMEEGADIVMVKPALAYLDIIQSLKAQVNVPIAAYQVSGEYQMLELMVREGLMDRRSAHLEAWTSMVRSGTSIVISYASREAKQWLSS